jgi:hypothetical protein
VFVASPEGTEFDRAAGPVRVAAVVLTNVVIGGRGGVNHGDEVAAVLDGGLDALADEPRPGSRRTFGDGAIEAGVGEVVGGEQSTRRIVDTGDGVTSERLTA